jgi:hypothetical protein
LLALVAGRPMGRIDPPLPRWTDQQAMLSHLSNLMIVNEQVRLGDPHRQQLTHPSPRRGVLVARVNTGWQEYP